MEKEKGSMIWFLAGVAFVGAAVLDLKCKGAFYKLLPKSVQQSVDEKFNK